MRGSARVIKALCHLIFDLHQRIYSNMHLVASRRQIMSAGRADGEVSSQQLHGLLVIVALSSSSRVRCNESFMVYEIRNVIT